MRPRSALPGVVLQVLVLASAVAAAAPEVPGDEILGPSSWERARGLLPEEILEHYRRGEYANPVVDASRPGLRPIGNSPELDAATRANRDRYAIDSAGSIVDAKSGQAAGTLVGLPFPEIEASDPQAGAKVVWNNLYSTYYRGDSRFLTEIVMLGTRGVERRLGTDVLMRVYQGAPEAHDRPNPEGLLMQTLARVVQPADLNGTVSLTWRYRDGERPDSVWTYVPGLRRPRQVNPLNRSDGFLGSDISQDDGPFFDGKPESFDLRLVGRQEMLVLIDPFSLRGEGEVVALPAGGYRTVWKEVPRIGADDPQWKGLPWAPVSAVLVRRPVWVVEATPRDPSYLYGKLVLRFDAETYRGSWASKYDRAGRLLLSYQVSNGTWESPDGGKTWVSTGGVAGQIAENLLYRRATAVLFPPRNAKNPTDFRIPTQADAFTPEALARLGE